MEYEWDASKDKANISKHGLPLAFAIHVFNDKNKVQVEDNRKEYGEVRNLTYGVVNKRLFCACWTMRSSICRIISVHPVHSKRKRKYYDNYQND